MQRNKKAYEAMIQQLLNLIDKYEWERGIHCECVQDGINWSMGWHKDTLMHHVRVCELKNVFKTKTLISTWSVDEPLEYTDWEEKSFDIEYTIVLGDAVGRTYTITFSDVMCE